MQRRTFWTVVTLAAGVTLFSLALLYRMQPAWKQPIDKPDKTPAEVKEVQRYPEVAVQDRRMVITDNMATPVTADGLDFDKEFAGLVRTAVEVTGLIERGETQSARALDNEGRRRFQALRAQFSDADERALFIRTGLMAEDLTTTTKARRMLCGLLIGHGLEDRARQRSADGQSRRLEQLVSMLLSVLPQEDGLAEDFVPLLLRGDCLSAGHESAVMDFVAHAAGPGRSRLAAYAADLLMALWRNLERTGARATAELDALALLFQEGANPVQRLAAVRRLLTTQGGRLREATMEAVLQRGDPGLAQALLASATTSLPPREAFQILTRLQPLVGAGAMPSVVQLGLRDPELVREAYELRLAQGTDPVLRAELVTGAAFGDPARGIAIAALAFREDQDQEVRARALLALTGHAAEGERALHSALDDPKLAADPAWLGRCVLALENLTRTADANTIDGLARRLTANPRLAAGDRARLEQVLYRTLPR